MEALAAMLPDSNFVIPDDQYLNLELAENQNSFVNNNQLRAYFKGNIDGLGDLEITKSPWG